MSLLITYIFIAIGISFLCSVLEAVLLSVTPSFVEKILSRNPESGKVLFKVKERMDQSISSILIVNTFAHTMGAAGVGAQASKIFGSNYETLIAIILTLVILYFSEIIPKTLGTTFWRVLAMPSAHTIYWLTKLVYPLVWFSTLLTHLFSKKGSHRVSREEIIAHATLGHKTGILATQENEYLTNVLRLREIKTEEILTPRSVVHSLEKNLSASDALKNERTQQFSRIPVYDEHHDTIIGLVTLRDLYNAAYENKGETAIAEYIKPIYRVSENLPVQLLLDLFIRRREHLFLVEDQFGQPAGIVTLEDAIETMLGREIVDETDKVEDLQEFAKNKYRDRLRQNRIDEGQ